MNDSIIIKLTNKITAITNRIEKNFIVRVIRDGLVSMIPILMIGAFALVLQSFPITVYQNFITSFANGFFYYIFHMIYMCTFGVMSVYMTLSFTISFFTLKDPEKPVNIWGVFTVLISFLILMGLGHDSFEISDLGATSVFLAMVTAIFASTLYCLFSNKLIGNKPIYSYGVDSRLNSTLASIFPATLTVGIVVIISFLVTLTNHDTMHDLIISCSTYIFEQVHSIPVKGFMFILISSILWCFGIHGSDVLQGASDQTFVPLLQKNIDLIADGKMPTEILTKQFFDCFILMGGCGSCICLLISILIFSKDKGMRNIAKTSTFPMIFNISELMVFGLPIVFNPVMVIPFIMVPSIQFVVAYFAIYFRLVPYITSNVEWTTPVFISGYVATGSVKGVLLQLVNIFIGVMIYMPFVKLLGRVKANRETDNLEDFISWFKKNEAHLQNTRLTEVHGIYGEIAKKLVLELNEGINNQSYEMYYQPQYNYKGDCIGVEALLRWPKVKWLAIYPPILIQLAKENHMLIKLDTGVLSKVMNERELIFKQFGDNIKISVNATGNSIAKEEYWNYLKKEYDKNPFTNGKLCIEVTEGDAISFDENILSQFRECKEMGIQFAIDDFSAGQTSVEYLKNGIFDLLKFDGALVLGINDNPRCREIITSLVILADSLNVATLAEYVETKELRQTLHESGCNLYQGYLYSPAIPLKRD